MGSDHAERKLKRWWEQRIHKCLVEDLRVLSVADHDEGEELRSGGEEGENAELPEEHEVLVGQQAAVDADEGVVEGAVGVNLDAERHDLTASLERCLPGAASP